MSLNANLDTFVQGNPSETLAQSTVNSTYFDTFEDRESAFNQAVGQLIPAKYRGARHFWQDFGKIVDRTPAKELPAYITADPRDSLAFGSPLQVIAAARQTAGTSKQADCPRICEVLSRFDLEDIQMQPIRSLSGGETVRLALAKAWTVAAYRHRLIIASPFCWMSQNHLPLLTRVAHRYAALGKPVDILAMKGEDDASPMHKDWLGPSSLPELPFSLESRQMRITLGHPINDLTAEPAYAAVADVILHLDSPCLLLGANGQGKSLLAKACSGARFFHGYCALGVSGANGRPRLLLQDVLGQTLLRTLPHLARSAARGAAIDPRQLYHRLADRMQAALHRRGITGQPMSFDGAASLLAVKIMLIAARLAHRPTALILDEPDWGLSRTTAIAFILAVLQTAHERAVPVVLISHKPWWQPVARSMVWIAKKASAAPGTRFTIALQAMAPDECVGCHAK